MLAVLSRAAGHLGGPRRAFDRAGLARLAGRAGKARATLLRGAGDGPAIAVVPQVHDHSVGTFASLSERECEVARLISRGRTNRQIADELFVSLATIKDHVHHILSKTGLANRAAVAGRWRSELTS